MYTVIISTHRYQKNLAVEHCTQCRSLLFEEIPSAAIRLTLYKCVNCGEQYVGDDKLGYLELASPPPCTPCLEEGADTP